MVFMFFCDCCIRTTAVEIVSVLQSKLFSLVLYFVFQRTRVLKVKLTFCPVFTLVFTRLK